jgi:hypothetical protein
MIAAKYLQRSAFKLARCTKPNHHVRVLAFNGQNLIYRANIWLTEHSMGRTSSPDKMWFTGQNLGKNGFNAQNGVLGWGW